MPDAVIKSSKRVLDPVERISEVLFGLIMVLTFTGSLSVADAGRDEVRTMLIGALGCNLAWGIIDGVLYLMGCLGDKGRNLLIYRAIRQRSGKAPALIAEALPPIIASVLQPSELESIGQRLTQLPEPPRRAQLEKNDYVGALGVFFLVFVSTFPVVPPFIFMPHVQPAMRISNSIAVAMLFVAGFAYGRCVGRSSWGFGAAMVILGAVMVGLTITFGG